MSPPREAAGQDAPVWASPGEFGQPAATDTRTGVATPLMAGFSVAVLASIAQSPESIRWPGATIFLLLLAGGLFVLSLQVGARSRGKLYSRGEALSWGRINQLPEDLDERVRAAIQQRHMSTWRRLQRIVQLAYNGAIAALGLALSLTAAPPDRLGAQHGWRWAAFALGLAFTVGQLAWVLYDEVRHRRQVQAVRRGADAMAV